LIFKTNVPTILRKAWDTFDLILNILDLEFTWKHGVVTPVDGPFLNVLPRNLWTKSRLSCKLKQLKINYTPKEDGFA